MKIGSIKPIELIKKIAFLICALFLIIFLFPANHSVKVLAASIGGVQCPGGTTFIAVFDTCLDFGQAIGWATSYALVIGTLIALVKLAIGAIQFIMSSGNATKLENARMTMTDAVVGLVLIVSAWVLLGYISASFPEEWRIHFFTLPFGIGGPVTPTP